MRLRAKLRIPRRRRPFYIVAQAFGDARHPGPLLIKTYGRHVEAAKRMAQEFRDNIYKQRFKLHPLNPRYLKWKIRHKLDPRILIATKKYVRAIGVKKTKRGAIIGLVRGTRIDITKTRDGKLKIRKIPYTTLARWLEYGTKRMKARPHWRPQIKQWKAEVHRFRRELVKELTRDLKRIIREAHG